MDIGEYNIKEFMDRKIILVFILIVISSNRTINAQEAPIIYGNIFLDSLPVEAAVVRVSNKQYNTSVISDS